MNKTQFLLSVLFITSHYLFGQSNVFMGVEAFLTNDLYEIHDDGNNLTTVPLRSIAGGATLRKELGRNTFIEGGIILKTYWDGFDYRNSGIYGSSDAFYSILIPCRFGYKFRLAQGFSVVLGIAAILGINTDYYIASGSVQGGIRRSDGSIMTFNYEENGNVNRFFPLIEPRLAIEKMFGRHFIASLHYGRSYGFLKVVQLDVEYVIDNSTDGTAKVISYGEYKSIGINVAYRISKNHESQSK